VHEENPGKIYRNRIADRSIKEFINTEYAPHREKLYKLAAYQLTRTDNPENGTMAIVNYVANGMPIGGNDCP
jgi:hypothetical protein